MPCDPALRGVGGDATMDQEFDDGMGLVRGVLYAMLFVAPFWISVIALLQAS